MADRDYKKPDYYADKAKKDGYGARSVFKLEEIDASDRLVGRGLKILDLGAAPGSWMQYCSERAGEKGLVVGVDLKPLPRGLRPNERFLEADLNKLTPAEAAAVCPRFDLVISDIMPNTIGHKASDHLRSVALAERALYFADELLKPGGNFLVKVFQGAEFDSYRKMLMARFGKVKIKKPRSSRKVSREIYLLGLGKKEVSDGPKSE
jgi:23S rRNA (uridine2552-2'-O)-methyltransferase